MVPTAVKLDVIIIIHFLLQWQLKWKFVTFSIYISSLEEIIHIFHKTVLIAPFYQFVCTQSCFKLNSDRIAIDLIWQHVFHLHFDGLGILFQQKLILINQKIFGNCIKNGKWNWNKNVLFILQMCFLISLYQTMKFCVLLIFSAKNLQYNTYPTDNFIDIL